MKEIVCFFGSDRHVGTSTIAKTAAEQLAGQGHRVLLLYCADDLCGKTMEQIRTELVTGVLTATILLEHCAQSKTLWEIGTDRPAQWMPQDIQRIAAMVMREMDFLILDAGSNLHLGTCVGALLAANRRILITTQQTSALHCYKTVRPTLAQLQCDMQAMLINKWIPDSRLPEINELMQSYQLPVADRLLMLDMVEGWLLENHSNVSCELVRQMEKIIPQIIETEGGKTCRRSLVWTHIWKKIKRIRNRIRSSSGEL